MIELFVGSIGCGKTCFATKLLLENKTKYKHCIANFPTSVANIFDFDDLETKFPEPNTFVVVDEAGICANNRNYKTFGLGKIEYFKLSGHNGDIFQNIYKGDDIAIFSQCYNDMDITIRNLVTKLWFLRRVGRFCIAKRVYKDPSHIDQNGQIVDGYSHKPFVLEAIYSLFAKKGNKTIRFCYLPKYWKYHTRYVMPERERLTTLTH